jgi:hypothetical protein
MPVLSIQLLSRRCVIELLRELLFGAGWIRKLCQKLLWQSVFLNVWIDFVGPAKNAAIQV